MDVLGPRALQQRARAEHVPVSALVRRLLAAAILVPPTAPLTVEQVEEIARRVARETLAG